MINHLRNYISLVIIIITGIIFSVSSCSDDYFAPVNISESDTISFSEVIQPILTSDCLGSGCHGVVGGVAPFLEEGLAYDNLIYGNYIDLADPEASILYVRINASSNFMPPASKLPELKIQQILVWIKQGALNN